MNDSEHLKSLLESLRSNDSCNKNYIFSKLNERFTNLVRHTIWDGKRDRVQMLQDIEDVVQEIMIAIDQSVKNNRIPQERVVPWVMSIARHKINDYFRKKRKRFDRLEEDPLDFHTGGPIQDLEEKELLQSIKRATRKLNAKDKRIINALINGEIKSFIHTESKRIPVNTVHVNIYRCRRRFEKLLKKEDVGYEMYRSRNR